MLSRDRRHPPRWFAVPRTVKLVEDDNGEFVLHACEQITGASSTGERIRMVEGQIVDALPASTGDELCGQPRRGNHAAGSVSLRTLELPGRAAEFLGSIVRTQIDRLTPWSAADAAFGWSKPAEAGPDRIVTTVAARRCNFLDLTCARLPGSGLNRSPFSLSYPEGGSDAIPMIKVLEERARGVLDVGQIRRALVIIIAATGLAAAGRDWRFCDYRRQP